jgi:glycosyltransferase involved in cell wall biosynthesis
MSITPEKVCVCIPIYNGEGFITQTLQSVLAQEYKDYKLIISDNASTDGTVEIAQGMLSSSPTHYEILTSETNIGMCPNWNKITRHADAKYILLLGADDLIYPEFLSMAVNILEQNVDCGYVSTSSDVVNETGQILAHGIHHSASIKYTTRQRLVQLPGHLSHQSFSTILFRKKALEQAGYFNESYQQAFDFDLLCRINARDGSFYEAKSLGAYRIHTGQMTNTLSYAYRVQEEMRVWQEIEERADMVFDPLTKHEFHRQAVINFLLRLQFPLLHGQYSDAVETAKLYDQWVGWPDLISTVVGHACYARHQVQGKLDEVSALLNQSQLRIQQLENALARLKMVQRTN